MTATAAATQSSLDQHDQESAKDAKAADFLKSARDRLTELRSGLSAAKSNYELTLDQLQVRQDSLDKDIKDIKTRLEGCYDVKAALKAAVCDEVIKESDGFRKTYLDNAGAPAKTLYEADEKLALAGEQLDSWQKITEWISKQQDKHEALIKEICSLDNCKDDKFALYIFFFELWPSHLALQDPSAKDPRTEHCDPCWKPIQGLSGFAWLVQPDVYEYRLAAAWKTWKDVGVAQAHATAELERIHTAKDDFEASIDPKAMREAARLALRQYTDPGRANAHPAAQNAGQ